VPILGQWNLLEPNLKNFELIVQNSKPVLFNKYLCYYCYWLFPFMHRLWLRKQYDKRGTDFYHKSISRHMLCCLVLTFGQHFIFWFLNLQSAKPSSAIVCGIELLCLFYVTDIHDGCVKHCSYSCVLVSNMIMLCLSSNIYIEMYCEVCGNWKFSISFICLKKQSCHLIYISVLGFPWFSKWKTGWLWYWRHCIVELPSI